MSKKNLIIGDQAIAPGETKDIALKVSETYAGTAVNLPVRVIRSKKKGPIVFLTGAVHGDELNGAGIVREIMFNAPSLNNGTLICIPVVNIFGFENHTRYLPDRRDLNRCFPGDTSGSLAFRLARVLYDEIISKSDYGIDLHTASVHKTNFPHLRIDTKVSGLKELALAFGCEIILNKKAPLNSLRGIASQNGCPTLLYEAGEVYKFEPGAIKLGVRGVLNVLSKLDMITLKRIKPAYQTIVKKTTWLRSEVGGLIHFHVHPGDIIKKGSKVASCERLFSRETDTIISPYDGIILGLTTLPAAKPGEPICHLAVPQKPISEIKTETEAQPKTLHRKIQDDLSTNINIRKSKKRT